MNIILDNSISSTGKVATEIKSYTVEQVSSTISEIYIISLNKIV